jgi:hypothetical protein
MNKIEKLVYDFVKSNQRIKNRTRNIYQTFFDILPRKKEYFANPIQQKEGYFFGFHDISPFSIDNSKVLANKPSVFLSMPAEKDALEVGYFDFTNGKLGDYHSLGTSFAWNHHKGCRLQWLDEGHIIFNTSIGEKPIARIVDLTGKTIKEIDYPIDTVSKDGRYATNFSYERLDVLMPGYGYSRKKDDAFLEENAPHTTGIFIIDITANQRKLLVSLLELSDSLGNEKFKHNYRHYVTHSEFSHDGKYISFLHRWVGTDVLKRWSRLVIFDSEKNVFYALPTNEMVSHYVWNAKNQIIAYCRVNNIDGHILFDMNEGGQKYNLVANDRLNSDGHQSFINNQEFVTDTYPDKYRMAGLFRANLNTSEVKKIAYIYSPRKYQTRDFLHNHIACDLHPRVSPDGQYVCFDTVRTGIRSIGIISLIL